MARKHYYITLELDVDLSSDMEKPTQENLSKCRGHIYDFINTLKRKLNYNFMISNYNAVSIYDEKGRQL